MINAVKLSKNAKANAWYILLTLSVVSITIISVRSMANGEYNEALSEILISADVREQQLSTASAIATAQNLYDPSSRDTVPNSNNNSLNINVPNNISNTDQEVNLTFAPLNASNCIT